MVRYRIYLLAADDHVQRASDIQALGDSEAAILAAWLWNACSAVFPKYELWSGTRRLYAWRANEVPSDEPSLADVTAATRQGLLELMQALQESHVSLARSERFLVRLSQLRGQIPSSGDLRDAD